MSPAHIDRLIDQLVLHEGLRLKAYKCPAGRWTIGVGRNFQDNWFTPSERQMLGLPDALSFERYIAIGCDPSKLVITREQAFYLLKNDIWNCTEELYAHLDWFPQLDQIRQRVLIDMAFNLGIRGLLKFKNTLKAFSIGAWSNAKRGMLGSRWAKQVGDGEGGRWDRAERLAEMALTGRDYIR